MIRQVGSGQKEKIKNVVVFAILMLYCGFTGEAHAAPGSGGLAVIDTGTPVAFAFNEAGVSGRNGITGTATLFGTSIDGTQFKLFETTVGYAESLTVTYYAWPELVSVLFEGTDGEGAGLSASVRLWKGGAWNDLDAGMLAALEFPVRLQTLGTPLQAITVGELAGAGHNQTARIAVAKLFVTGRRAASVIALALWTLAVFVAASLWYRGRRPARVIAALVCLVCAATATAFMLGSAPAELFAVPVSAGAVTASGEAGAESVLLERQITDHGSYSSVSWSPRGEVPARSDGLRFMGVRSPQTAAVPVSAFSAYRRLRFKTAPLVVTSPDGRAMLAAAPFMLAWGLHE